MSHDTTHSAPVEQKTDDQIASSLRENLTAHQFSDFHQQNERDRNAEEGYGDTRNDPSHTPADNHHSPSQSLNCHRMQYYDSRNAPREGGLPHGIFKFGHDFEAYAQTFIEQEVAPDEAVIRNVEQIDFEVDGLHYSGSTDPVAFDSDGDPVALFEVKTVGDIYFVEENGVNERHKAQAHIYARGLEEKYGLESPPPIFFIYGDREELDVAMYEVAFDVEFWEDTVLDWGQTNTEYRRNDELPPTVDSDKEYMCGYCDYAERCGNYEPDSPSPHADEYVQNMDDYWWDDTIATSIQNTTEKLSPTGFLPLKKYPEEAVVSHLVTYPDVSLTPTLATQYPALVADSEHEDNPNRDHEQEQNRLDRLYGASPTRDVSDWACPTCMQSFSHDQFHWDGDFDSRPTCPDCPDDNSLRGRKPGEMLI